MLLNYFQFFFNSETINFLFTDDLWVIVGGKYDSLFEKYFCCGVISPFASIYFQTLYSLSSTDQIFINLLFIVGQLLPPASFLKHLRIKVCENSYNYLFTFITNVLELFIKTKTIHI